MSQTYLPRTIAQWYHSTPDASADANVQAHYASFKAQCFNQYAALIRDGLTVVWQDENPYASSKAMFANVRAGVLCVLRSDGPAHGALNADDNTVFRTVHDYYGHYLGRNSFGPKGELAAFHAHAKMFTGAAVLALATETLGQNSWVNYGPHSHLKPAERPYAPQKAILFPSSLIPTE